MSDKAKPYWEIIRELEKTMFPEFRTDDIISAQGDRGYANFAPSWHFRSGLITQTDVHNFLTDTKKKLLSVGSGPAFLEILLERLGINRNNLTPSDIDVKNIPQYMKGYCFDMFQKWPDFDNTKYDLIIFPESVLINIRSFDEDWQYLAGIYHIITQALQHLTFTGTIRMNIQFRYGFRLKELEKKLVSDGHSLIIMFQNNLLEIKRK
jgi:hypothetical protein